eukprot:2562717-Pyramimonas_sp.AAC.2
MLRLSALYMFDDACLESPPMFVSKLGLLPIRGWKKKSLDMSGAISAFFVGYAGHTKFRPRRTIGSI